jgi:hypothetical protein
VDDKNIKRSMKDIFVGVYWALLSPEQVVAWNMYKENCFLG